MDETIQNAEAVKEARRYVERAMGGIDTLHLGPLDYNVTTTVDYLRTAAAILEEFGRERGR
jgi:hypothetical protein